LAVSYKNWHKKGAVKKAQQSPWISSIWKLTGFNISHSKKELSNLEKRVQQTHRQKIQRFLPIIKMLKNIFFRLLF